MCIMKNCIIVLVEVNPSGFYVRMSGPHFTTADKKVFWGSAGFSKTIGRFVIKTRDKNGKVRVRPKKFTSRSDNHTEQCFYLDLTAQMNEIAQEEIDSIEITINNSPCGRCRTVLRLLMQKLMRKTGQQSIRLVIRASNLYGLRMFTEDQLISLWVRWITHTETKGIKVTLQALEFTKTASLGDLGEETIQQKGDARKRLEDKIQTK